jgi:hypothetical protein
MLLKVRLSLLPASCLAYSLILKIEAIGFFETSVDFYRSVWRYIPEAGILQVTAVGTSNPAKIKIACL